MQSVTLLEGEFRISELYLVLHMTKNPIETAIVSKTMITMPAIAPDDMPVPAKKSYVVPLD